MIVDFLPISSYQLLNKGDVELDILTQHFNTQATINSEERMKSLFQKDFGTHVFVATLEKETPLDCIFDKDQTIVLTEIKQLLKREMSSAAVMRKLYLKMVFGLIYDRYRRNPKLFDAELNDLLVQFLGSIFAQLVGLRSKIVTKRPGEWLTFHILTKKYILDTIIYPGQSATPRDVKRFITEHYDATVFTDVMTRLGGESISSVQKYVEALKKFNFVQDPKAEFKNIVNFASLQVKTWYYLERREYLVAFLYCIKASTYQLFDDQLKKRNKPVYLKIIKKIYKTL